MFQSTRAPRGARDQPARTSARSPSSFNPRAPREGRATARHERSRTHRHRFNPRAPREGRATSVIAVHECVCAVSIHARPERGARPRTAVALSYLSSFQSTRAPRGARDADWRGGQIVVCVVSIHARPERGARLYQSRPPASPRQSGVSIHARPERGARLQRDYELLSKSLVSIHARPERGARLNGSRCSAHWRRFQSTRAPRGARDAGSGAIAPTRCGFNPRAPREGRATPDCRIVGVGELVSIHARPERGARPRSTRRCGPLRVFQSTRAPRGARDL